MSCAFGSYLSTAGNCVQNCSTGCLECNSNGTCTLCTSGYAPNNAGVCLPCLSNCRICSGQANGVCLRCG